jgi:hypothetical protein
VEEQLLFPWGTIEPGTTEEDRLDVDKIKAMLGSADRIKELLTEREKKEEQLETLKHELDGIDDELGELTGQGTEPVRARAKQKCSLCGEEGHTKRTCPTGGIR